MASTASQHHGRPAISAAVITMNEEAAIARCLDSLHWCDQVVVVDSGSTDRTAEIVRSYSNTELHVRPFDNFISQRNHALDFCRCDWVLSIDADEVIPDLLAHEIQRLPFDAPGYQIGARTFVGTREIRFGVWNPDHHLRLFRRSAGRWGGSNPHEAVQLEGRTPVLRQRMLHYGFDDIHDYARRNRRYTELMAEYLASRGRRARPGEPLIHGVGNFLKTYVLRAGFLDGALGLQLAAEVARNSYRKYQLLNQVPVCERQQNRAA